MDLLSEISHYWPGLVVLALSIAYALWRTINHIS